MSNFAKIFKYITMKKVVIILSVMAFIAGCCGGGQSPKSTEIPFETVVVSDSVMVMEDYVFHFNFSLLEFPTIKDKQLLDKIYVPADIQADDYSKEGLLAAIKKYQENEVEGANQVEGAKMAYDANDEGQKLSEYFCAMGIFSQSDGLLTIGYQRGCYLNGAAHPWYSEQYRVFDLQANKMIANTDVFKDVNDERLGEILMQYLEKYLEPVEYTVENVKTFIDADKILVNSNFYFNETEITFVYNQYEIAPYAIGVIYVTIPFAEIGDYLRPSFSAYLK